MGSTDIRNIALIGHSGEGKTSLAEAMLFNANVIDRLGSVDDGTTVTDYGDEEIRRGMSIDMSVASFEWLGKQINLIDTPGGFDFIGESLTSLSYVGACVIVASANCDISVGTEKAIAMSEKLNVPAILFISKVEKDNHDYATTLAKFLERYPKKFAVIQIPIIENNKMIGNIDVLDRKAYNTKWEEIDIPTNLKEQFDKYLTELTELAAESSEELLEKYFAGEALTEEEIINGIKARQAQDGIIFVMGGSCTRNKGVKSLMDEIARCARNPYEVPGRKGKDTQGNDVVMEISEDKPFSAQVFKTYYDAYVGRLSLIKVQTGCVTVGETVINTCNGKTDKIGGLFKLVGKKQVPITKLCAGDIGAVSKLSVTATGDTICSQKIDIVYNGLEFPKPMLTMAIESEVAGEEDKIGDALARLHEEDKMFTYRTDSDSGQLLLSGIGDIHLAVIINKINNRNRLKAKLVNVVIPYKETITSVSVAQGKYKKQSGGHGQYGDVRIRFETSEQEFEFSEEVVGGSVPKSYIPAVEKGLRECMNKGVLYGFRMVGVKAVLTDGSYHDVDSSEMAFKMAASLAYKDGIASANPIILEPINDVEVTIDIDDMGDVLADLSKRRGKIIDVAADGRKQVIYAEVPYGEMQTYVIDLRALTRGRGEFTAQFKKYDKLPAEIKI